MLLVIIIIVVVTTIIIIVHGYKTPLIYNSVRNRPWVTIFY